jgi:manganese/zinc/iron transport system ATP- binding protein
MQPTAIEVHDLCVTYDQKPVLWDIDLTVSSGSLTAIVGPNGAGKSTLLKAAMGLLQPTSGYVSIFDSTSKRAVRSIGYVPQRESVDWDFPISVEEVVLMGRYGRLGLFRRPSKYDRKIVAECLDKVQMTEYAKRQISQLSGGQQQRIFIARALAQQPDIYLMDEPFAGIDATTENTIVEILKGLQKDGKTIVAVHHDLQTIPSYFDSVILLNLRLIACGKVQDVFTAENLQKTFGGRLTILDQVTEAVRTGQQRHTQDSETEVKG